MPNSTFTAPELTTFAGLDGLGLTAIGQHLSTAKAEILCHVTTPNPWCATCGAAGVPRDTVIRRLATNPWDGDLPSWSSNTDATEAATAITCGAKICPKPQPSVRKSVGPDWPGL